MKIAKSALLSFFVGLMPLFLGAVCAQESTDPRTNAIDPAALAPAPAFGDSGPASKSSAQTEHPGQLQDAQLPEEGSARWRPRLRIELFRTSAKATALPSAKSRNGVSELESLIRQEIGSDAVPADAQQTQDEIVLLSDSVNLDARKGDNGELSYSLTCEGRISVTVNGLRISGRDCSVEGGTMTIRNAEMTTQENLLLQADRLTLRLSLAGVKVNHTVEDTADSPCTADEKLTPVPDPIGQSEARSDVPDKFNVDHAAPKASDQVGTPR